MGARTWVVAVAFALLATCGGARAEDKGDKAPKSKWEFEVEPYAWLTGNSGTVTVKGRTTQIDVSPEVLWGLLEDGNAFGAAGYLSASYDRFSFFVDSCTRSGPVVSIRTLPAAPTAFASGESAGH